MTTLQSSHHLNTQRADLRGQLNQLSTQSGILEQRILIIQVDNYTLSQLELQVIPSRMSIQHRTLPNV